ncbi:hypothetical protein R3P38DRAFT_1569113 [Favolaschia claudopus]|uniref:Uncharacterized protein n=1 Tax=Favolaschia claudopus TaxID=2862362 RepID=A0AAW0AI09_9AGAR
MSPCPSSSARPCFASANWESRAISVRSLATFTAGFNWLFAEILRPLVLCGSLTLRRSSLYPCFYPTARNVPAAMVRAFCVDSHSLEPTPPRLRVPNVLRASIRQLRSPLRTAAVFDKSMNLRDVLLLLLPLSLQISVLSSLDVQGYMRSAGPVVLRTRPHSQRNPHTASSSVGPFFRAVLLKTKISYECHSASILTCLLLLRPSQRTSSLSARWILLPFLTRTRVTST